MHHAVSVFPHGPGGCIERVQTRCHVTMIRYYCSTPSYKASIFMCKLGCHTAWHACCRPHSPMYQLPRPAACSLLLSGTCLMEFAAALKMSAPPALGHTPFGCCGCVPPAGLQQHYVISDVKDTSTLADGASKCQHLIVQTYSCVPPAALQPQHAAVDRMRIMSQHVRLVHLLFGCCIWSKIRI
jgi:hypothetical protein